MTDLEGIQRMVRDCVERSQDFLGEDRCAALRTAADRCDLPAIHDLLVAYMIERKGISYTATVLGKFDEDAPEANLPRQFLH